VKIGLFAINYGTCGDPEAAVEAARYAEAAGFESVWTGEHVVLPNPRPPGGPFPPTLPLLDTTVALTLIAAHTTTLKIASGIIILPLRNPVVLAKELASIDVVSRGRLIVGVAAGYIREEFEAAGVSLAERHQRTDEYIQVLGALWAMDHPMHHGRFVSFEGIDAHPRPVQRPGPPLVAGGESQAALVRAVTMADGWYGFDTDAPRTIERLDRIAAEHERPERLGSLEITITPTGPLTRAVVEHYEQLGIDRLVLLPQPDTDSARKHRPVPLDQIKRNIETVAAELDLTKHAKSARDREHRSIPTRWGSSSQPV
jgi:probable F420-dependent oxidoreductase